MPLFDVAWTSTCPSELFLGVMESKVAHLILDIVVHQVLANFIANSIIIDIEFVPLEAWWQRHWVRGNVFLLELLDLALWNHFFELHNWLAIPEPVLTKHAN